MLGRRLVVWLAAAIVCGSAAVVALGWPGPPSLSTVDDRPPRERPAFLDSIGPPTTLGQALPTTVSTIAAPEPLELPRVEVDRGSGRRLRVGSARPVSLPATVADAAVGRVALYNGPGDGEPADTLPNPTHEGLPLVFLVQQQQGQWLEVQVPMRPNQATAWVRAADVTLRQVPYRVVIDLSAHRLTAYREQAVVLEAPVAIGSDDTPTPTGSFYIDGAVRLADTSGPYGAYQLSVAAFSNVHFSFGGGVGQIAIHGTNNPALIGTPVSNGCVRMRNEDILQLASTVPVGTPVHIVD